MNDIRKNVVFAGGGFRSVAYIGALRAIEEQYGPSWLNNVQTCSGVSAGALFAFMCTAGIPSNRLEVLWRDAAPHDVLGTLDILLMYNHYGLHSTTALDAWLKRAMDVTVGNADLTFEEMRNLYPRQLNVFAVNVNSGVLECFNADNTPSICVRRAIMASMAIPVLFTPVEVTPGNWYVDGAVCDNFPILKDYDLSSTIGFCIGQPTQPVPLQGVTDYLNRVLHIATEYPMLRRISRLRRRGMNIIHIILPAYDYISRTVAPNLRNHLIDEGQRQTDASMVSCSNGSCALHG